jgi:prolyl-tRNA editing enzyme YbaK/EbsC (Cys-tRNA(Pro) deacylase)
VRHRREAGWEGQSSKCILFHARGRFYLVVTTADREIKARLFKRPFGTKDIRFATPEEVRAATGCEVGSVPPFGHSAPDLPVFVDGRILAGGHFLFNPAVPTESLRLGAQDLRRVYAALPNPVTVFDEDAEGRLAFAPL